MFLFFSLTQQSENVSVLEQSIQTCIKIFSLSLSRSFFKMFVLKHQFCFVFVFGNGKEWRRNPLLGWRKQCWELHCEETPLISSVEVSTSLSLLEGKSSYRRPRKGTLLVGESLTGLFPTTGCAPHVSLLHAVHLSALLRLPTGFPW